MYGGTSPPLCRATPMAATLQCAGRSQTVMSAYEANSQHLVRIDIGAQRGALAVIDRIASNLEFAPSATDTASWYDARQALPS